VATAEGAHRGRGGADLCDWVSALGVARHTDLLLSGANDGHLRFWRADAERNTLEHVWAVPVPGFINAIEVAQKSRRFAVAAVGQEHRLGRWFVDKEASNGLALVPLPRELWVKDDT